MEWAGWRDGAMEGEEIVKGEETGEGEEERRSRRNSCRRVDGHTGGPHAPNNMGLD